MWLHAVMTSLQFEPNLDGYWDVSSELVRQVNARTEARIAQWRAEVDEVATPAQARGYQQRVRAAVLAGIGGLPAGGGDLDVEWLGPVESGAEPAEVGRPAESQGQVPYRIDRLIYHSLPGVPVTANLYRPASAAKRSPGPAVLLVCGHAESAKAYGPYQAVCARLTAVGISVLSIDPFGQGERFGYLDADAPAGPPQVAWGTTEHTYAGIGSWWIGQGVARWFVHDARRGIDLLASLPEVDPTRIGITGSSGGGTLCTLMMALEPRLAAAAPGTFVTSRGHYLWSGQSQDAEQILLGGTERGVDHDDLLAVMAPRPVAVLAAEYDFFPHEGAVESVARARRIFDLLGAPAGLRLVTSACTHQYSDELAVAAVAFFAEAFGLPEPTGSAGPAAGTTPSRLPADRLRCTASGQVGIDRPDSLFVHDLTQAEFDRHSARLGPVSSAEDERMRAWVRDRVYAHRRPPAQPDTRWLPGPGGSRHAFWRSERDLWGAGVLLGAGEDASPGRPPAGHPAPEVWIGLLHNGTTDLSTEHPLSDRAARGDLVFVPDVRGQGALAQRDRDGQDPTSRASTLFKIDTDLLWLADSLAAGRVFDVTRAIDVLLGDRALRAAFGWLGQRTVVHLYGEGLGAFHAVLAATVVAQVASVQLVDPVVDTDQMVTQRRWDEGRGGWQALIPGLAVQAPLRELERMLGDRLSYV